MRKISRVILAVVLLVLSVPAALPAQYTAYAAPATFGLTTQGTSNQSLASNQMYMASNWTVPANLTSITGINSWFYCRDAGTQNIKFVIVNKDKLLIGVSSPVVIAGNATAPQKYSANFSSPVSATPGQVIYMGVIPQLPLGALTNFYYNSDINHALWTDATNSYATPTDPTDMTLGVATWDMTIYADYQTTPAVTTGNATNITYNSAQGQGSITDLGTGGNVTYRGYQWGTSLLSLSSNVSESGSWGTGNVTNLTMTGLSASTLYYYRVFAQNGDAINYGSTVNFTTTINNAPTVTTNNATGLNSSNVTGNMTINLVGAENVTSKGFQWNYGITTNNVTETGNWSAGNYTATIAGLTGNTTYSYRAWASNSYGISYGSWVNFTTNVSTGITTASFTTDNVSSITQTSAIIAGSVISTGGESLSFIQVDFDTENLTATELNGYSANSTVYGIFTTGNYSIGISRLLPGRTYYVKFGGNNTYSTNWSANVLTFTTTDNISVPTVVSNGASSITSTTAIITGNLTSSNITNVYGDVLPTIWNRLWGVINYGTTTNITEASWSTTADRHTAGDNETVVGHSVLTYSPSATNSVQLGLYRYDSGNVTTLETAPVTLIVPITGSAANPSWQFIADNQPLISGRTYVSGMGNFTADLYFPIYKGSSSTLYPSVWVANGKMTPNLSVDFSHIDWNKQAHVFHVRSTTNITQKQVQVGLVTGVYTTNTTVATNQGLSDFTIPLAGLNPNTHYFYRIGVQNGAGWGYSPEGTFDTGASTPTITTQAVSSITTTTAIANGTVTATGGANATSVFVQYGLVSGVYTSNFTQSTNISATTFTVNMTGLTPGTTYFARVGGSNIAGISYGGEVSFTTSALPPTPTSSNTIFTTLVSIIMGITTAFIILKVSMSSGITISTLGLSAIGGTFAYYTTSLLLRLLF